MNKRIRELALQAGYSKDFVEIGLPGNQLKFAELIVQECIDAAEQAQADFYVINNIKTRFGVEE